MTQCHIITFQHGSSKSSIELEHPRALDMRRHICILLIIALGCLTALSDARLQLAPQPSWQPHRQHEHEPPAHQPTQSDSKIIGGEDAPATDYPYQISLQVRTMPFYLAFVIPLPRREWQHNCGGSILTRRHVITAAHCLVNMNASALSVWAGTTKLSGADGTRLMVADYIVHPDYVELNRSDLGIVTTSVPFSFGATIQPIRYTSDVIGGGVRCVLTGWGYTNIFRFGGPPNNLQRIFLDSLTNEQCMTDGQRVDRTGICTAGAAGSGACGVSTDIETFAREC